MQIRNIKLWAISLSVLATITGGWFIHADAATIDKSRDCDNFAVIKCGTMTAAELRTEYDSLNVNKSNGSTAKQSDIPAIFTALGIKRADLNGDFVKGAVYQDGTVKVGGKTVAKNAKTAIRNVSGTAISGSSTAKIVSTSKMGSAQEALVRLNDKGQFVFAVMTPCGNPVSADNTVPEPPKPVYECTSLTPSTNKIEEGETVKFTTKVVAKDGAKVKDYQFDFGDGTKETSANASISHKYTKAGTFTAKVIPRFTVDGKTVSSDKAACRTTITVKAKPAPTAKCESLAQPVITNRTNVALKATANVTNGATISSYVFTIVDASGKQVATKTVTTTNTSASTNFTVQNAGTYTAKVVVKTSLGEKSGTQCEQKFTIKEADKPGVSIEKTVNGVKEDVVTIDQPFTYELLVKNTGNTDLKAVKIEDKAPEGVTFQKASAGTISNNVWTHTIDLKKGAEVKFTITAVVTKHFEDGRKNTACVDAPAIPGKPDDCDDAKIKVKKPGINITKKVEGVDHKAVETNVEFTYQIRVTNSGQTDLKNVVVTDNAEAGVTFIRASHGTVQDRSWTYTIPELKQGAHMDFTITAKVPEYKAGAIKNTVCVDAPSVPGDPDDCDNATVEVPAPEKMIVCVLDGKKYPVTIDKGDFDEDLHSEDPADCDEEEVPPVLPETGAADTILGALGIGALTTSLLASLASRRDSLIG